MNNLVFVYGTLKLNRGNYNHILKGRSKYLGEGVLTTPMVMKQLGFPAIYDGGPDGKSDGTLRPYGLVKGDLFEVTGDDKVSADEVWKRLDSLESNGYMYQREERDIGPEAGPEGGMIQAWVYIATPDFQKRIAGHVDIEPNDRGELIWS